MQPDPHRDKGCEDDGAHPRSAVGESDVLPATSKRYIQSNPLNRSPNNCSIRIMVEVLADLIIDLNPLSPRLQLLPSGSAKV